MEFIFQNYIRPYGNSENFKLEIDSIPYKKTDYYKESVVAAQMVESNKSGKLYLMYSGGVDSEYALSVFLDQGIDIIPVVIKLNSSYNKHDTDYAFKFCQKKNIQPLIIDIDYDNFVTSGKMFDLAIAMKSSIPHYTTTAYAISQLEGTVICGDGEPHLVKDNDIWNICIYEYEYSLFNFYVKHNIKGVVHFNRYTPQMFRAFIEDIRMKDLANNKIFGKQGSHSSKWIIYNRYSNFELEERPKYHGFELIEKSPIKQHDSFFELEKIGKQWDGIWRTEYHQFINNICI
jgi:hypothetical protein